MKNALLCTILLAFFASGAMAAPAKLRCEYRENPLGIDQRAPRLSWLEEPGARPGRDWRQSAYRILVASSPEILAAGRGDLWDSGKVLSDRSIQIAYSGTPLRSRQLVHWKVMTWDAAGKGSSWSVTARWSMGLLDPSDWHAKWIGKDETSLFKAEDSPFRPIEKAKWIWHPEGEPQKSAPAGVRFFRTTFDLPPGRGIQNAVLVAAADPGFDASLNGKHLVRGTTPIMPSVVDLMPWIRSGPNALLVKVNHDRNNRPAGLIGAIRVEFADGGTLALETDERWESAADSSASAWLSAKAIGGYGIPPWGETGHVAARVLPARMLRKELVTVGTVRRATVYMSGLGLSELAINGQKPLPTEVLSPALTDYAKRTPYVACDITPLVKAGPNAIGVWLGNGRYYAPRPDVPTRTRDYGYPKLLLQLEIEYADGRIEIVTSDDTWKLTTGGPIRGNNEYDGEYYDARREMPGWNRTGFDDSAWEQARIVPAPAGALSAQRSEPIRVMETLQPVSVTEVRPGRWIFDMGKNMVGWVRLSVQGQAGTSVRLRHAETLDSDGLLYTDNLRSAMATDVYVLKGGGVEVWEPRFTYHGFRYVELTGFPGKPGTRTIAGQVVHDAIARAGELKTSNSLLNRVYENIYWGTRGNYRSMPTDCPQRDERQGWLGDRSWESKGEAYLFNIAPLYAKWLTDIADSQLDSGSISDVAPAYWPLYNNSVTWPGTFVIVPGNLYDHYGDLRVIAANYEAMKKWMTFMRGFIRDDLMPKDTYGDWCVPPESKELIHSQDPARKTDPALLGTAWYIDLLGRMSRYARLLDKPADATDYDSLAARMKSAFEKRFFRSGTDDYGNGSQTSSILPLAFGITPESQKGRVFASLANKIETGADPQVGTGLVGGQWLMRVLADNGRVDLAYRLATRTAYPSWGYMISRGATTMWELWNGDTADPAMNSGNHVMLVGDLNIWFHENLAGIRPDPEKPGFKHFFVAPQPAGDLTMVRATHQSPYGEIVSHWTRSGARFHLDLTVPPNTTATVILPGQANAVDAGSGRHQFESTLP